MHFDLASDEVGKDSLDPGLRRALLDVPRHLFVPQQLMAMAYRTRPCRSASTRPCRSRSSARRVVTCSISNGQRILEIGTGLGYQAA